MHPHGIPPLIEGRLVPIGDSVGDKGNYNKGCYNGDDDDDTGESDVENCEVGGCAGTRVDGLCLCFCLCWWCCWWWY